MSFIDVDGDQRLMIYLCEKLNTNQNFLLPMEIDARGLWFSEWFLFFFEFLPMSNLSALGEVLGYRFFIQVLRYF
jgi:hypothetical protein